MRLRKVLRKIHRWTGMLASVWLLLLAVSGLLLQHADWLQLNSKAVTSTAVLKWFDVIESQGAWDTEDGQWYQINNQIKLANGQPWAASEPVQHIRASTGTQQELSVAYVLASSTTLYWANAAGELIQTMDGFDGIPSPITQITIKSGVLMIEATAQWYQVGFDGSVQLVEAEPNVQSSVARTMTASELEQQLPLFMSQTFAYDKVIHGIHSGLKGSVWLNTLSALALLYLCFSGIYLFFKPPKNKPRK